MGIRYEVVAITGKYTNKDGEEKNRYTKLGAILDGKNGLILKIEAIPVGWDGWAYLNEPQEKDGKPAKESREVRQGKPQTAAADDDIPF